MLKKLLCCLLLFSCLLNEEVISQTAQASAGMTT